MPGIDQKAHGFVLDSVRMPAPELFTGTHNGEMVKTFQNAHDKYIKLAGISDKILRPYFPKLVCQTLHILCMISNSSLR